MVDSVIFEGNLYEWCRMPFGLRSASHADILSLCGNYVASESLFFVSSVDDMTVGFGMWEQRLSHVRSLLTELRKSGLSPALNKCKFACSEVRFVGHIVGSGRHRPDEQKLAVLMTLDNPQTKKEMHCILGFFKFFHAYISHLAELTARFTAKLHGERTTKRC